ncbi:TetR/AcrR family transcriptional regulator [candidate division KSB1 bacterium]|nr:TetR/AcrR family transcriptional regulator [candidate division KSB1 bacterium]MBL7093007.1 TetR/AcrR family transcriptional regulator [candidate division KSB1 bacterium]
MPDIHKILVGENETKINIFRVAAKLFAEKGYNGVSMREISEKSKVSKPTIYYYFGSKEGVFKDLVKVGLQYGSAQAKQIASINIPVKERLVKIIQNRFFISFEHPDFSKFFLMVFMTSENLPFLNEFQKQANIHRQLLVDLIQEGVDSSEFGAGANPQLAAEIIAAVLGHFIGKQLREKKKILTDELAEEIIELLFKGLNE